MPFYFCFVFFRTLNKTVLRLPMQLTQLVHDGCVLYKKTADIRLKKQVDNTSQRHAVS